MKRIGTLFAAALVAFSTTVYAQGVSTGLPTLTVAAAGLGRPTISSSPRTRAGKPDKLNSRSLFDVARLSKPPEATFGERQGLVQEVFYQGEPLAGKPTRVFAYYAKPDGPGPFPGMVLVHGGGGKAFADWARHWAEHGYAAIAMDLSGNGPTGPLPDGAPDQSDTTKFRAFTDADARDMWTYHAVADAILAHSLLESRPEVDRNRIGLTGISWGGYLTCIIAGLDHQFKVAVPVYGCGFLHEDSYWKEPILDKMPNELRERWVRLFDPSRYLAGVRCPILFLNGTNDFAYPLDSYRKCYDLVHAPKMLSVQLRLPHGHIWTYGVVDAFVDSVLTGKPPLPKLSAMQVQGKLVGATFTAVAPLAKAELYYTTDGGHYQQRNWLAAPAKIDGKQIVAELPATAPTAYYIAVTDAAGNIVTCRPAIAEGLAEQAVP